jgi:hypothetical protein
MFGKIMKVNDLHALPVVANLAAAWAISGSIGNESMALFPRPKRLWQFMVVLFLLDFRERYSVVILDSS